jgi:hypothetical protein
MTSPVQSSSSLESTISPEYALFEEWLANNERGGWIEPLRQLQTLQPNVLSWADIEDLVAIFTKLGPCNDASMDALVALFGQLDVAATEGQGDDFDSLQINDYD